MGGGGGGGGMGDLGGKCTVHSAIPHGPRRTPHGPLATLWWRPTDTFDPSICSPPLTQVSIVNAETGEESGTAVLPAVFKAPIRTDVVQ